MLALEWRFIIIWILWESHKPVRYVCLLVCLFVFGQLNHQSLPSPQVVTDPEYEWLEIIIMIRCNYCFLIQNWMTSNGTFSPFNPFPVQTYPQGDWGTPCVRPKFPAPIWDSPGLGYQQLCKHAYMWTHTYTYAQL